MNGVAYTFTRAIRNTCRACCIWFYRWLDFCSVFEVGAPKLRQKKAKRRMAQDSRQGSNRLIGDAGVTEDVEAAAARALSIAKDARRDINRVAIASEERDKRTAERFTQLDGALRGMADTVGELSNNVLRLLPRVSVLEEQHRTLQDISAFGRVAVSILKFIAGAVVVGAAVVAWFVNEG
jgi:hypothetical protein